MEWLGPSECHRSNFFLSLYLYQRRAARRVAATDVEIWLAAEREVDIQRRR
jgi:hypothetical protein